LNTLQLEAEILKLKISNMEKMIELKKGVIANIRKVQEMIQQGE
jgi:hypothetical protein